MEDQHVAKHCEAELDVIPSASFVVVLLFQLMRDLIQDMKRKFVRVDILNSVVHHNFSCAYNILVEYIFWVIQKPTGNLKVLFRGFSFNHD